VGIVTVDVERWCARVKNIMEKSPFPVQIFRPSDEVPSWMLAKISDALIQSGENAWMEDGSLHIENRAVTGGD
jgi:hypothetical protein